MIQSFFNHAEYTKIQELIKRQNPLLSEEGSLALSKNLYELALFFVRLKQKDPLKWSKIPDKGG